MVAVVGYGCTRLQCDKAERSRKYHIGTKWVLRGLIDNVKRTHEKVLWTSGIALLLQMLVAGSDPPMLLLFIFAHRASVSAWLLVGAYHLRGSAVALGGLTNRYFCSCVGLTNRAVASGLV